MFSANENILLRQHKKRVVEYVESTIPEDVLDLGINVMAMQVTCITPGCVPIETAIIIIFPKLNDPTKELLPGLPESAIGGSYKTKILKPLVEVTKEDVLDALPPSFMGGTKSMETLCYQIRDNLFAQITQLFDIDDITTTLGDNSPKYSTGTEQQQQPLPPRLLVAQYIQECLQQYINHNCIPPEIGQPYPDSSYINSTINSSNNNNTTSLSLPEKDTAQSPVPDRFVIPRTGNITIPRPMEQDTEVTNTVDHNKTSTVVSTNETLPDTTRLSQSSVQTSPMSLVNSSVQRRQQVSAVNALQRQLGTGSTTDTSRPLLVQIATHARGIRRPGCPCCDPDNASTLVDQFLSQT